LGEEGEREIEREREREREREGEIRNAYPFSAPDNSKSMQKLAEWVRPKVQFCCWVGSDFAFYSCRGTKLQVVDWIFGDFGFW
jgi:hypothetical protein